MKALRRFPRLAGNLVAGIVIGLFASRVACAEQSNVFRYSTPQTGSLNINQAALTADNGSQVFDRDHGFLTAPTGCFQTGVFLPDGARLTRLTVWYSASVASKLQFLLFRDSSNSGLQGVIASRFNTDTSGNRVSETFVLSGPRATINNNGFSYVFMVCFSDSTAAFASARLTYKYRDAGD
jgi:hypothetical protein